MDNNTRAPSPDSRPRCVCGEPWRLGSVHRSDGPCFVYQEASMPRSFHERNEDRKEIERLRQALEIQKALTTAPDSRAVGVTEAQVDAALKARDKWYWDEEHDPARCSKAGADFAKRESMRAALAAALGEKP